VRDFSRTHEWLSLNTATVRRQGDLLAIIEACARHDIRAISPWRDQVAQVGLERAARAIRQTGLKLSGYCRGGMFTADPARRGEIRDDNRRAIDEAKPSRPTQRSQQPRTRSIPKRARSSPTSRRATPTS